jgi:hypothetical protein
LSYGVAGAAEFGKHVEAWAQKIAGRGADAVTLEIARSIARAELDLVQIRRAKVAVIARMSEFGELDMPNPVRTRRDVMRFLTSLDRGLPVSLAVPVSPSMPSSEPERSAEAVRRALPELLKLDRYERRAVARRDRAIRHLIANRAVLQSKAV